jgi:hypothetical protein
MRGLPGDNISYIRNRLWGRTRRYIPYFLLLTPSVEASLRARNAGVRHRVRALCFRQIVRRIRTSREKSARSRWRCLTVGSRGRKVRDTVGANGRGAPDVIAHSASPIADGGVRGACLILLQHN